jgi:hypothetical protein
MSTVQEELLALTKVKPKAGESAEDFTVRVFKKADALADADAQNWEALSDDAQVWVNKNKEALENETELYQPLELPEAEDEPEEKAEEAASGEQEKVVAKTVSKNGKVAAKPKSGKSTKVTAGRGRKPNIGPLDAKIKVLSEPPFRKGTLRQKVFAKYKPGMTVAEARKAGIPFNHMKYHVDNGFISLGR